MRGPPTPRRDTPVPQPDPPRAGAVLRSPTEVNGTRAGGTAMPPHPQNPGPVPAAGGARLGRELVSPCGASFPFRCCSQQTLSAPVSPNQCPLPTAPPVLSIPVSQGPVRTPLPWGLRPWSCFGSATRRGLRWPGLGGGGLPAPVPTPEPGRALHALPEALAWCPQAFAERVQGHVLTESKLLCRPG